MKADAVNPDKPVWFGLYWELFTNVVADVTHPEPLFQYCVKVIGVAPDGKKLFSENQ